MRRGPFKTVILTHWDADGICSSLLIRRWLEGMGIKVAKVIVPPIGVFGADEMIYRSVDSNTILFVTDLNLDEKIFSCLIKRCGMVINFDHHIRKKRIKDVLDYNLPLASTTKVISKVLGLKEDFFVVAGEKGDSPIASGDIKRFADFIDMPYKTNSRKNVLRVIKDVWRLRNEPEKVLRLDWIRRMGKRIEQEVDRIEHVPGNVENGILIKEFACGFNVISGLGRRYSSLRRWKAVYLANRSFFRDKVQLYIRLYPGKGDIEPLISKLKGKGYSCGGKKEVLGAVVPCEDYNSVKDICIDYFRLQ